MMVGRHWQQNHPLGAVTKYAYRSMSVTDEVVGFIVFILSWFIPFFLSFFLFLLKERFTERGLKPHLEYEIISKAAGSIIYKEKKNITNTKLYIDKYTYIIAENATIIIQYSIMH